MVDVLSQGSAQAPSEQTDENFHLNALFASDYNVPSTCRIVPMAVKMAATWRLGMRPSTFLHRKR